MNPSRTVMIVEDTEIAAATLEMALLRIPGLSVILVASAKEALQVLENGHPVDALVTDLNMPQMDGFELIERVRAGRHARLPIVVVTADPDPGTPDRVRRLGVDAYFSKPYSPAQVRQKVEQLLNAYDLRQTAPVS
jgi:CheY-like chemotaxis protein